MFIKINSIVKRASQLTLIEGSKIDAPNQDQQEAVSKDTLSEDEIRRQMYARIARGNALNEVEDNARRAWRSR